MRYLRIFRLKKVQKKLIDKLVEACSENIDGNKMVYNSYLNDYKRYVFLA